MKPLKKLTGTDRQTERQTGAQDYVLSQADALTKNNLYVFMVHDQHTSIKYEGGSKNMREFVSMIYKNCKGLMSRSKLNCNGL